ncbi:MAG: O-linked N-acetylglucosamine transferase, SPINDLY family protein [Okeania sp. SIO3H1]|nr:O-linked N-acetylglucosamine transferase, SPINDLY family protein [Okeania sp. SIO3H1]
MFIYSNHTVVSTANWQQQATQCLLNGEYAKGASFYEAAIAKEPEVKSHYWHLGLMLILQEQEVEAQTTWLLAMADGEAEEIELWTAELAEVLETEAERREVINDIPIAWALRQHLREISPRDADNLLRSLQLSIKINNYRKEELSSSGIIELLQSDVGIELNTELLMQLLRDILDYAPLDSESFQLAKACIPHVQDTQVFIDILVNAALKISLLLGKPEQAAELTELGLPLEPENTRLLLQIATFHQNAGNGDQGIEFAKQCYDLLKEIPEQVFASHIIIRGLMHAGRGHSTEAKIVLKQHESLLSSLIDLQPKELKQTVALHLFSAGFYFPYVRDNPVANYYLRHKISEICQKNIEIYAKKKLEELKAKNLSRSKIKTATKPLKIGYLSHCLRTHSVGWLARWLFEYYNREKFHFYTYLINSRGRNDYLQDWYVQRSYRAYEFTVGSSEILDTIYEDDLDILIDLDSITLDVCCELISLKLAPIQATWLGWDTVGLPAVDYFIVDPYVLPDNAQDYYSEKIWRLPQTYIAVDGFEVSIPSVRRDDFGVSGDAVIYLTAQSGYKYNLDTIRLQLKIIKEVPDSYLFIKDLLKNRELIQDSLNQLAEEEGINPDRIKFMPRVNLSETHRANLGIADVVLDTYPYNGATTTMETLWMCVPIVTRVGEQFAARNSYTMMMNAGITEGIAWSDEEYVEWGIRLGKDEKLRQEISWKLRKSKQTAPLWNAKQFTREMEKAYEGMWQKYIEGGN